MTRFDKRVQEELPLRRSLDSEHEGLRSDYQLCQAVPCETRQKDVPIFQNRDMTRNAQHPICQAFTIANHKEPEPEETEART